MCTKRLITLLVVALIARTAMAACTGANNCCGTDTELDVAIAANTDNGVIYHYDSSYPPPGGASWGVNVASNTFRNLVGAGPNYTVQNGMLRFNTAGLPDAGITLTHAYLVPYYSGHTCTDSIDMTIEWYHGGSWESSGTLGGGDYAEVAPTSGDASYAGSQSCAGATGGRIASTDLIHLSEISATGFTGVRLHVNNRNGVTDTAPSGVNQLSMYSQPDAAVILAICYAAGAATSTPTNTPANTPTMTPVHCNTTADCANVTPLSVCPPTPG